MSPPALCVTADLPAALWIGAALLLCHLIGLTYVAKQETLRAHRRISGRPPSSSRRSPTAWR